MIDSATRTDIILNRFAYTADEQVLVNASDLCSEILAHDKLQSQVKYLSSKIDDLKFILSTLSHPTYRSVNLKA